MLLRGNGLHSRSITLHRYGIRSKGFIDATVRDEPHARTDIGCRAITRHPKLVMGGLRACIAIMSSSNVIVLSMVAMCPLQSQGLLAMRVLLPWF